MRRNLMSFVPWFGLAIATAGTLLLHGGSPGIDRAEAGPRRGASTYGSGNLGMALTPVDEATAAVEVPATDAAPPSVLDAATAPDARLPADASAAITDGGQRARAVPY